MRSDDWDFPTNKLPNVGWLGRVHRGTPWQTVYLKSPGFDLRTWAYWTGNGQAVTNYGQFPTNMMPLYVPGTWIGVAPDAYFSQPTNDWHLLDLFTTALNANATRGQLSINQPGLAAWSAVLSGVDVFPDVTTDMVINPAGVYDPASPPPLVRLVNAINYTRSTNSSGVFRRLGDILSVPELTVGPAPQYIGTYPNGQWVGVSPYLNLGDSTSLLESGLTDQQQFYLSDAVYERIPQQILGLLKLDPVPRFVVYSYGQTLKPADKSLVTSGSFFGLCTNYQIMAEAATRAVIRIEGAPTNTHAVVESFNLLPPD
jgi:hypothetical protein